MRQPVGDVQQTPQVSLHGKLTLGENYLAALTNQTCINSVLAFWSSNYQLTPPPNHRYTNLDNVEVSGCLG